MVISVGGDGTFLDASHHVNSLPLLGINSSRSSSFGHFCLASLKNIEKVLDDIENDNIKTIKLLRLELLLNGKVLPDLVLNEVLIAHSNPAAASRFIVHLKRNFRGAKIIRYMGQYSMRIYWLNALCRWYCIAYK